MPLVPLNLFPPLNSRIRVTYCYFHESITVVEERYRTNAAEIEKENHPVGQELCVCEGELGPRRIMSSFQIADHARPAKQGDVSLRRQSLD